MQIEVLAGKAHTPKADVQCELLPLFMDGPLFPSTDNPILRQLVEDKVIRGKSEEVYFLPTPGGTYKGLLTIGLGKRDQFNAEVFRRSAGKAAGLLEKHRVAEAVLDISKSEALPVEALIEGLMLAQYRFDKYKDKKADDEEAPVRLEKLTVLMRSDDKLEATQQRYERAVLWTQNTNWARDLGNLAPNELTPAQLGDMAKAMAREMGCDCEVLDEARMEKLGMNALLGVAKGSEQRAVLIILRYRHPEATRTLAIVGKGVTFDTGGISIKPSQSMHEMKYDMCGAAAALGAMRTICALKPIVNVVCAIPAVENMLGPNAQKPGDIVKAFNGKTIEIDNTDAEGRLILCDAMAYIIQEDKPDRVVDIATLTGGAIVALGHYAAGLMTNNEALNAALQRASDETGERVWRLPIWDDYEQLIKGTHADLNNIGPPRQASTIIGGCFLKQFVGETPWAHVDIAGTASGVANISYYTKNDATGFGVRLLTQWVLNEAENANVTAAG